MENNQRNSRKRLNSLILLVAFTAVMLIVSTYAWFSAQKNVTISNLEGKVNVAEGLMVSLDAKTWSQEVDFEDYDQNESSVTGAANYKASLKTIKDGSELGDNDGLYIINNIPTELIPVSTTGKADITETSVTIGDNTVTTTNGYQVNTVTGSEELNFYAGVNVEGHELYDVKIADLTETVATQTDFPGYFAIDIFLQNSSKIGESETQGEAEETLQLNTNSLLQLVTGGSATTGLQNTARVALAMYEPVDGASLTSAESTVTSSAYVTANQSQILNAYKGATISDVAIWEPNASDHIDAIITNVNDTNPVTSDATVNTLYGGSLTTIEDTVHYINLASTTLVPTFALTYPSMAVEDTLKGSESKGISNIYNWTTTDGKTAGSLSRQIALQTEKSAADYTIADGGVRNLISITSDGTAVYKTGATTADVTNSEYVDAAESGVVTFDMLKNTVVKCRLYVWLEGQDVDCINVASHGSGIHLDLGLVKGQKVGSGATEAATPTTTPAE